MSFDRRRFLGLGAGALAGGFLAVPKLVRAEGPGGLLELSGRPANYESLRSTFSTRITPLDRFYIRSHFDVPEVDTKSWRLKIQGSVASPLEVGLEELRRMPQTQVEAVLQCSGNGRALFRPRMPGVQWARGAMGNALWRGVRLGDLLARAKPSKGVAHLWMRGADAPAMDKAPVFLRGIPIHKALHEDTLVALTMNGEPLSAMHGAPARLVVPGWVGDDWVKWLTELTLSEEEPKGFFYETAYRFPTKPGAPGEAVPPEGMGPMTEMVPKSIIASHEPGQVFGPGPQLIRGVALSGTARVKSVEVSVDGGQTWARAKLEPASRYGFTVFAHPWSAVPGKYRLVSKATDESGQAQPLTPRWNPSGYLYNALDPFDVEVKS